MMSLSENKTDLTRQSSCFEPNPSFQSVLRKFEMNCKIQLDTSKSGQLNSHRNLPKAYSSPLPSTSRVSRSEARSLRLSGQSPNLSSKGGKIHHIKNVYQQPLSMKVNSMFKVPVFTRTLSERQQIQSALSQNFVFKNLSDRELKELVNAFETCQFKANDVIIQQGHMGDYFYIIKHGIVIFQVNGEEVGNAAEGSSFGELSLLYTCPRAASVIAHSDTVTVFRVDQTTFRVVLESQMKKSHTDKVNLLKNIDLLQNLCSSDLERLANTMRPRVFKAGDVLIEKGREGTTFFVIHEGSVIATDVNVGGANYDNVILGPGECFGELSLLTSELTGANVKGVTPGVVYQIDKQTFVTILGKPSDLVLQAQYRRGLSCISFIQEAGIKSQQLSELAKLVSNKEYEAGTFIMQFGKKTEASLYLVRSGRIEVESSDGNKQIITRGGYFGVENLRTASMAKMPTTVAQSSAKVIEDCACGVLSIVDSKDYFGIDVLQSPDLNESSLLGKKSDLVDLDLTADELAVATVKTTANLDDLTKHKILGEGTFGQVWLVSETLPNGKLQPYALKIQSKYHLAMEGQISAIVAERDIMINVHHPFLINLIKTFQDADFIYMLLELIQGGELFTVMHGISNDQRLGLKEDQAKFYALPIADALAYLHHLHYIYRDLKSENIMIDKSGYPVLIDFGFAKYLPDNQKSYTLCGTPSFLSPEMLLTRGHDRATDHWALGILIYELITGENPFFFEGMDQMSLFQAISEESFDIPSNASAEAIDLVTKLLVKDPSMRLGSLAQGERDILQHAWFDSLDLHAMRRREVPAPWIPNIQDPLDTSCFDDWSYLEDKTKLRQGLLHSSDAALFEGF